MVIRKASISAGSEEEFNMRVSELEKRGYEMVKVLPVSRPEHREISYDSTKRGRRSKNETCVGYAKYRAVMQKDFVEA